MRLAHRPEKVVDLPWRVLRAVPLPGGTSIPLLDEAFEACGPSLLVNVELKSAGIFDRTISHLVAGVRQSIRRCQVEKRVIVSSFDPRAVGLWKRAHPEIPSALLFESGSPAALVKAMTLPFLRPQPPIPRRPCVARTWYGAGMPLDIR